ncbi:MAG: hypothetical protein NTV70_18990 [Acidobacteria bacterium]|nr:hypothetical protein [Acidobacteriota bacterium]
MMRRWLLNLLLAAVTAYCGWTLRQRWLESERRLAGILAARSAASGIKAATAPADLPLRPADFFEVAEKFLFSKDRNPAVVAEVEVPKPMPPLPVAFGVMDLGQGPVVFLSLKGEAQRAYHAGETVGDFKLLEITATDLTLEWNNQRLKKRLEELRPLTRDAVVATAPDLVRNTGSAVTNLSAASSGSAGSAPASASSNIAQPTGKAVLGAQSGSLRLCVAGDQSAEGTVVDGFRKVFSPTPFGKTCLWEPVK